MREELVKRGLNLRKLADLLGIDRAFVTNVVNRRKPGYKLRIRLVRELGFPLWVLDDPKDAGARRAA